MWGMDLFQARHAGKRLRTTDLNDNGFKFKVASSCVLSLFKQTKTLSLFQ